MSLSVCNELDSWLVKNGADLTDSELVDSAISGCMIYCEPPNAKSNVEDYIEEKCKLMKRAMIALNGKNGQLQYYRNMPLGEGGMDLKGKDFIEKVNRVDMYIGLLETSSTLEDGGKLALLGCQQEEIRNFLLDYKKLLLENDVG